MSPVHLDNLTTSALRGVVAPDLASSPDFQSWKQTKILDLAPVIVLDVLFMLFGVVGNSIVCYVCYFRMPRNVINSYVLSLAALELLGCVFTLPVDFTELLSSYSFHFPVLCKTERYFRKFIIFSTGCILVAIATERYKRIVKPYSRHVTMYEFRCAVFGTVVFSGILAAPEAVLAGSETVQTPYGRGLVCSTYHSDRYRKTVYPKLWGLACALVYVLSTVIIGLIYFVIAAKIWKRGKVPTDRRSRLNTPDSTLQRRVRYLTQPNMEFKVPTPIFFTLHHPHHNKTRIQKRHSMNSVNPANTPIRNKLPIGIKPKSDTAQLIKPIPENQPFSYTSQLDPRILALDNDPTRYKFSVTLADTAPAGVQPRHKPPLPILLTASPDSQTAPIRNPDNLTPEAPKHKSQFLEELMRNLNQRTKDQKSRILYEHEPTDSFPPLHALSPIGSLRKKTGYSRKRTTFIMFVMTLTTAVSHLPHIAVMLYKLTHPGVDSNLQPDISVVYRIFWNSFFISLATHPFVYGFWNGRFKHALCSLLTGFSKKAAKAQEHRESCSSLRQS